jgi:hypothetical protein
MKRASGARYGKSMLLEFGLVVVEHYIAHLASIRLLGYLSLGEAEPRFCFRVSAGQWRQASSHFQQVFNNFLNERFIFAQHACPFLLGHETSRSMYRVGDMRLKRSGIKKGDRRIPLLLCGLELKIGGPVSTGALMTD